MWTRKIEEESCEGAYYYLLYMANPKVTLSQRATGICCTNSYKFHANQVYRAFLEEKEE